MKIVHEVLEYLDVSRQTIYSKLTDNFKKEFTTIKNQWERYISY